MKAFDAETLLFQVAAQQIGAPVFVVARFGKAVDLLLQGVVKMEMAVEVVQSGIGACAARSSGHRGTGDQEGQQQEDSFHGFRDFFESQPFRAAKSRIVPPAAAQVAMNPPPRPFTKATGASVTRAISTGAM